MRRFVTKRKLIFAGFALFATLAILFVNKAYISTWSTSRNVTAYINSLMGYQDAPDAKLKILSFDDKSIATLKKPRLSIKEWTFLIQKLSSAGVKKIIIDKKFGFFDDSEKEKLQQFGLSVKLANRVVAGAALHSNRVPLLEPIQATERPAFDLERIAGSSDLKHQIPLLDKIPYGAPLILRSAFANIGYLNIEGNHRVMPVARLAGGMFLPYVGVNAADRLSLKSDGLYLNGVKVPRFSDGSAPVKIFDPATLYKRSISIGGFFSALAKGYPIEKIVQKGDTVLILPAMFTGNTDMEPTVFGYTPRGFMLASFINSILTSDWIAFSAFADLGLAVLVIILFVFILSHSPVLWFYGALLGTSGICLLTTALLSQQLSFETNFLAALFFPFLFAVVEHVLYNRKKDVENLNLKMSLRNALPEHTVNEILSSPEKLLADPKEAILTIMFIDIACFSLYTEKANPTESLQYLTELLEKMTEIVHAHGGFVDKSLGDGMLCVFGHEFSVEGKTENQADQAIAAAIALQKMNVDRIETTTGKYAPLPLRIGINTGKVHVGNLGGKRRTDFTVIGKSVNFAQRLESACEQHRVLISHSTYELSHVEAEHGLKVHKRLIQIKHHSELLEVVELDPFKSDELEKVYSVDKSFRDFFSKKRKDERWPAELVARLHIQTEFGESIAIDFSTSGACLLMDRYLASGVRVSFSIDSEGGELGDALQGFGLSRIDAEVKWGKKKGDKYLHGLHFDRLNLDQKVFLRDTVEKVFENLPLSS